MKTEKKKSFDCIEQKRKASLEIYERTKDMTLEQELEYWRTRDEALRLQIQEARDNALKHSPKK
jgi:hypothetical protein